MAGLLDVLKAGVKVADSVTKTLQATVGYERCTAVDKFGHRTYAASVDLLAILDLRQRQVRSPEGVLVMARASVTFLDLAAVAAATAGGLMSERDRITLPDGSVAPVLTVGGFADAAGGPAIPVEVSLG